MWCIICQTFDDETFEGGLPVNTVLYLMAVVVAVAALYLLVVPLGRLFFKFRGTRLVTCPETNAPAAVKVDALRAAMQGPDQPGLQLQQCSRWPERQGCGQECLHQIEAAPEDCLVRSILTRWYAGKSCVFCGKKLDEIDWMEHKPALMSSEGKTLEWHELAPEAIPEVLATHRPVCWNCHIARTFRRQHPDLVVDRSWKREDLHKTGPASR
jgi:hypothetical protein